MSWGEKSQTPEHGMAEIYEMGELSKKLGPILEPRDEELQ